jgi:hypothetical protein
MKEFISACMDLLEQFIIPQTSIYQSLSFIHQRDEIYSVATLIASYLAIIGIIIFVLNLLNIDPLALIGGVFAAASALPIGLAVAALISCCCICFLTTKFSAQNPLNIPFILALSPEFLLLLKISSTYAAFKLGEWGREHLKIAMITVGICSGIGLTLDLIGINLPLLAFLFLSSSCIAFFKNFTNILGKTDRVTEFSAIILGLGLTLVVFLAGFIEPEALTRLKGDPTFNSKILWFIMSYYFPFAFGSGLIYKHFKNRI